MIVRKPKQITLYTTLIILLIILFFVLYSPAKSTSAQIDGEKSVKNVLVCEGDSLWSIAKENYTELDGSLSDYVNEIRMTNQMSSDAVRVGTYLIVPYYVIHD